MKLYGKEDLENIPWPENPDGQYAKAFLEPILKNGTQRYFKNIKTAIFILIYDQKVIPITVACPDLKESYVASPYCHFISYAKEELYLINSSILRFLFRFLLNTLACLFRFCKINQAVYINNWFLSTNLHPEFTPFEIEEIRKTLLKKFPSHTQIYRSVNEDSNKKLIETAVNNKYKKVFSRQVYMIKDFKQCKLHKDYKNDCRILSKTKYKIHSASLNDAERLTELYNDLYVGKYSKNNPQFTKELLENLIRNNLLQTVCLSKNDNIEACYGYFQRNGIMTAPLFGVNTSKTKKDGLYRILSLLLIQEAEKQSFVLNNSSGASKFKMHRGAKAFTEYMLVFYPAFSFRGIPWLILHSFITPLARLIFKKYQL